MNQDCKKFLTILLIICVVIGVILAIALPAASVKVLESNEVGLDYDTTTMKIDEENLYVTGRHFLGVSHYFIIYTTDWNSISVEQLVARSSDGLQVNISAAFQYKVLTTLDDVLYLFYNFPWDKHKNFYYVNCRDTLRNVIADFQALDMVSNQLEVESKLRAAITEELYQYKAQVENFQLLETDYPEIFTNNLNQVQNLILQIPTAENNKVKVQNSVDGLIKRAESDAQVQYNSQKSLADSVLSGGQASANAIKFRLQTLKLIMESYQTNLVEAGKTLPYTPTEQDIDFYISLQWGNSLEQQLQVSSSIIPMKFQTPPNVNCYTDSGKAFCNTP